MNRITSLFVWKVLRQAQSNLDHNRLLRDLGIDPDAGVDPAFMVADTDYYDFFETLARADRNGIELSLRTGESMLCDDYGAFGLAWKSAPNLRASWERLARYAKVLTSVSLYEVRPTRDGVLMLLHREGERRLGLRLSNEATIAAVASVSRQASLGNFQPLAVYFKHPAPGTKAIHEQHFSCPVQFDAGMDALLVSEACLAAPNRLGDQALVDFFDLRLEEEMEKYRDEDGLQRQVRALISRRLSEGVPTLAQIAAELHISSRTLQRRLASEGHSFQSLVDICRRQLAEKLLKQTRYPLTEVAFLTGFTEQSAFNRAFRRWAGKTPRSYRLESPDLLTQPKPSMA